MQVQQAVREGSEQAAFQHLLACRKPRHDAMEPHASIICPAPGAQADGMTLSFRQDGWCTGSWIMRIGWLAAQARPDTRRPESASQLER